MCIYLYLCINDKRIWKDIKFSLVNHEKIFLRDGGKWDYYFTLHFPV